MAMFILVSPHNRAAKFAGSLGMVGSLDGTWLARDGVMVIDNANDLADEWQVKSMTSLFHDLDGHQYRLHRCLTHSCSDYRQYSF